MLKFLFITVCFLHGASFAESAGYQNCQDFLINQLNYDPTPAANMCQVLLNAGDAISGGSSIIGVPQVNPGACTDASGTKGFGKPARCLGVFYGLSALGEIGFQVPNMGCGSYKDPAHRQCINMMTSICSRGVSGLCWWTMGLATNDVTFLKDGLVSQDAINKACYREASINPLLYSATTGCLPDAVKDEPL